MNLLAMVILSLVTVSILHRGRRGFQGIGLAEVIWKTVSGIINHRLMSVIVY